MDCAEAQLILQKFDCSLREANAYSPTLKDKLEALKEHVATCFECERLALKMVEKHEMEAHDTDGGFIFLLETVSEGTDFNYPPLLNPSETVNAMPREQQEWLLSYTTRYYPLTRKEKETLRQAEPRMAIVIDAFSKALMFPTIEEAVSQLKELYDRCTSH